MPPKVSVIVPVYNTESYLADCLDSLANQTLRDIEIVCVDDGSADSSPSILARHAELDARIRLLSQPNQGPASARNAALDVARGEYLCFIDSDDRLAPDALRQLFERASSDGLDVLFFGAAPFSEDDSLEVDLERFTTYYRRTGDYPGVWTGPELLVAMSGQHDYKPAVCFQMVRRGFREKAGLRFFDGILHEDNLFTFLGIMQAERAGYLPETFYERRVRPSSIMTTPKSAANIRGYLVGHVEMARFLGERRYDDPATTAATGVCIGMYRQALKIYCDLSVEERKGLTPSVVGPRERVAWDLLVRNGADVLKLRGAQKKLDTCSAKLDKITASRSYRFSRFAGNLLRGGRKPRG